MNLVVTGGAGFIGSHIVEYLIKRGDSVTVIDDLNTGKKENLGKNIDKIHFIQGDIRDFNMLKENLRKTDGVFHQAALASVQESFAKPDKYFDVNVKGTENIFKLAKEFGFKVVYASSSSVYGNPDTLPMKEDSAKNPINPYAKTKLDVEHLAQKYAKLGARIIGLRYFNVFGPRQSKEYAGVIKLFLGRIQDNMPPKINGDGLQSRDFVFVGDVVRANILAMEGDVDHAFINIGSGDFISVLDLANIIINSSGLALKPIHGPALEGDVQATQADVTLAKKLLNWQAKTKLQDWLQTAVEDNKNKSITDKN